MIRRAAWFAGAPVRAAMADALKQFVGASVPA